MLRENAGHATTITLTVTLEKAAAVDTKVTLDFVGPSEGNRPRAMRISRRTGMRIWDVSSPFHKARLSGTAKVSVTPTQNTKVGDAAFTVQATSTSGSQAKTENIVIADDDSASTAILLSVDQATITETDGEVSVTVTATLSGGGLEEDTVVTVGIAEDESSAERDGDYVATFATVPTRIQIASGELSGTTSLTISPIPDEDEEGGETIVLTATAEGLATGSAQITLNDGEAMDDDDATMATTMATLTMATLTMATLTMATLTMATLTMATLTTATLTTATLTWTMAKKR